jgi:hypothetical protein
LVQRAIPLVISGNLGGWLYSAPNGAILARKCGQPANRHSPAH